MIVFSKIVTAENTFCWRFVIAHQQPSKEKKWVPHRHDSIAIPVDEQTASDRSTSGIFRAHDEKSHCDATPQHDISYYVLLAGSCIQVCRVGFVLCTRKSSIVLAKSQWSINHTVCKSTLPPTITIRLISAAAIIISEKLSSLHS